MQSIFAFHSLLGPLVRGLVAGAGFRAGLLVHAPSIPGAHIGLLGRRLNNPLRDVLAGRELLDQAGGEVLALRVLAVHRALGRHLQMRNLSGTYWRGRPMR